MADPTTDDQTAPGEGQEDVARHGSPGCTTRARNRARATTSPLAPARATHPTTTTRPRGRPHR
ncbi:hypothetical protein [Actinosynnema mirum]|uniref:Uncharacterized protein n=1 Tax=Actinosynnema mirum (strain ATCC 29888 / DSM 43827 / JCM 3225 / NBRC 14064 / NCIMB 13271 / NRRL B-12336 / IMRU 3971 / 101) TaxID=446462 RepID=C6WRU9_ACTMD|nr:hypothetical protein [Actinosynnema mirum]ACU36941.1 hypothetical protein Amir_3022 [Actinosynnema mirum DSM 43827]